VGAVAGISSFACLALRVTPPREYLIVLAALAATGVPAGLTGALRECGLVAAGALTGIAVTMAPALSRRRAVPQARAVQQAWSAVQDVLGTAGTPGAARVREDAVAAMARAHEVLRQARAGDEAPALRSLAAAGIVLASALSVSIDAPGPLDPQWAAAVRNLAVLAGGGPAGPANPAGPEIRTGTPAWTAAAAGALPDLRWALGAARRVVDRDRTALDVTAPARYGLAGRLREALSPDSVVLPAAARIAIAVAAGAGLGRLLGLDHSYWVGLTAAAALQATNVTLLIRRSLHRVAGTIAGVGLAGALFALHPAVLAVAIVVLFAQFAAEVLIRASYGLAITFVTILALSLYDLAGPGAQIGAAVGARILDTALGAALAVLLRLLLWPQATGQRLPQARARTLRAVAVVFRCRWLGEAPAGLEQARRRLQEQLAQLRTIADDAAADQVMRAPAQCGAQVTLAIDELAVLALGVPYGRPPPRRRDATALVERLEDLAAALEGGRPPPDTSAGLELPAYPRTRAAANLLASAIA
jgi:uncharacterized membrane protein YccC